MPTFAKASVRKRVLIVQRSLAPPGGGNAVAAWMAQALIGEHTVGTLTERASSAADTNQFYGTAIPEDAVATHLVPMPWRLLSAFRDYRLNQLRMAALLRAAGKLAASYDLLITADNFGAFTRPGIQYVHFPAGLRPAPARLDAIVNAYFWLCEVVRGYQWQDAAKNLTLVNSRWTAAGIERLGEIANPIVLYPPVVDPGPGLPWSERDDTFLCVSRFHGSKRIELVISIAQEVRARSMPGARLVIVGSAVDPEYSSRIRRLAAGHGDWIEFREDLSRRELDALMGRSRYGIQAMVDEHFGMATAEMTRAGCLVFAHDSGGSPEVLNAEPALLWSTREEAVQQIIEMNGNATQTTNELRARLRSHAQTFSTERFVDRFREIVASVR